SLRARRPSPCPQPVPLRGQSRLAACPSRSHLPASGVRGRLARVLRAALAAPPGAELWCPHHPAIWTRLQDGQGLSAVPDRLIRHDITAFGGDAFGVTDGLPGVIAGRGSRLLVPPLSNVAGVVQRQVGLHGSGSSSITVSCRKPGFGCPYSWVARISMICLSSAMMPASASPS